jgi:ParB-like chromosome segregation protein Spo0J
VSGQLQLLPSSPPAQALKRVELDRLDGFADASPSRALREQLRALGLLQPIVAVPTRDGRFRIVDGRRRAKAIAQLAEQGDWPAPPAVELLILGGAETARRSVCCGLTLALHASRSASPASELAAIEAILETARDAADSTTIKEIAAQTGISVQTVRRRLRLRTLTSGLRRAFDQGLLATSVTEAAARLPAAQQQRLTRRLEQGTRLTLAEVRNAAREQTSAVTAELPDGLFTEREIAWQATVRGHLTAALAAIPPGEQQAPLAGMIGEALARAENS